MQKHIYEKISWSTNAQKTEMSILEELSRKNHYLIKDMVAIDYDAGFTTSVRAEDEVV